MNTIPNLNTLRFVAASLVIFQHIELYKASFGLENFGDVSYFKVIGNIGVVLFFVLSAFLITILLLKEKEKNETISFKNFYLRRILRIWPLYYLIVLLGFFVLPHISFFDIPQERSFFMEVGENRFTPNVFLYLLGFPHLARTLYGNLPYLSQTWSLATEQLFYVIWPFVIMYFNKKLMFVMLLMILLHHAIMYFLITKHAYLIPYSRYILSFLCNLQLHCMAIGGIFAVIVYKKGKLLNLLFNKVFFTAVTIITIVLILLGKNFATFHYDIYAVLLAIIISNLAFNPIFSNALENKITNYFGVISYGMYMYHCIILVIAIRVGIYFNTTWLIYPLTFLGTIFISHISYKYFENYFLRVKVYFENR